MNKFAWGLSKNFELPKPANPDLVTPINHAPFNHISYWISLYNEMEMYHFASDSRLLGEFIHSHWFSSGEILVGGMTVSAMASFGYRQKEKTPMRRFPERFEMPLEILFFSDSFEFLLSLHARPNIYDTPVYVLTIDIGEINMAGFRLRHGTFYVKTNLVDVEEDFAMLRLVHVPLSEETII